MNEQNTQENQSQSVSPLQKSSQILRTFYRDGNDKLIEVFKPRLSESFKSFIVAETVTGERVEFHQSRLEVKNL